MKKLSQFTILFLVSFLFSMSGYAASTVSVRSFTVKGLEAFKGKRLSLYYVSGRPATLETPGQIAKVRKVLKGPLTYQINSYGEVSVDAVEVPRDGWTNFNNIIFVVHGQAKHSLQNVDGTLPDFLDAANAVPFKTEYAQFLYRKSLEYTPRLLSDGILRLY